MAEKKSHQIKYICPECGKSTHETGNFFGIVTLACGHLVSLTNLKSDVESKYEPLNELGFRQYQIDGVKFAESSPDIRCLIGDEQGLGKTWQALGTLKLNPDELLPAIALTKTTLTIQWWHEIKRLLGQDITIQIMRSGKEKALPGFDLYVLTYDLAKGTDTFSMLYEFPKTLILDECQAIKNRNSGRAGAVQSIGQKAKHIIALSGTPIKNHAGEYFTVLNLLQPRRFPSYEQYVRIYCDSVQTAYGTKVGGLANPELFFEDTKDFIIRRTRAEAAPELPTMERVFHHVELSKKVRGAYQDAVRELDELLYRDEDESTMTNMLAIMAKMRKITGLSKAMLECVEYVTDWCLETESDRKITIFVHHHTVMDTLVANLNKELKANGFKPCLVLSSSLTAENRADVVQKFKNTDHRILVASTLAAGEGLNLQFCSDAIMLERQWNPANEEQAEGRFIRLGRASDAGPVRMVYMIATETIDEYFTELVEAKRAIMASTLDGKDMEWDSNSLMKELAQVLVSRGKEKWSLAKVVG